MFINRKFILGVLMFSGVMRGEEGMENRSGRRLAILQELDGIDLVHGNFLVDGSGRRSLAISPAPPVWPRVL
jgi:hypothetical protein